MTRLLRKQAAIRSAVRRGLLGPERPVGMFFDLDDFTEQIRALKEAFPPNFEHCMAVKAQPTRRIMERAVAEGLGLECASIGELTQALRTGCAPSRIVFDSPIKTEAELRLALERGVPFNIDNWQELDRVVALGGGTSAPIGLRINPQVGAGDNAALSTGTATSKFGIGLEDDREAIVNAYRKYPWLTMAHIHTGSQGVSFELAARGIRRVVDLVLDVNRELAAQQQQQQEQQIRTLDIGGGVSVNFASEAITPTFAAYAAQLKGCARVSALQRPCLLAAITVRRLAMCPFSLLQSAPLDY